MAHLLHIDSSPRSERSHSRRLTREFVEQWKQNHPGDIVTYRDIGRNPIPPIDEAWIAAAYAPPDPVPSHIPDAIRLSEQLINEFLSADLYVIGVPMYNFSIPSVLKAYIDQIVRPGRTFGFQENAENRYKPLVLNKQMVVITARGDAGFGPGERNEKMNYQDPYLRTIFGFMGITDISFISVENDEYGGTSLAQSLAQARTQMTQLIRG